MDLRLDGETRLFVIVGDPIAQVKSPTLLSEILHARGENALVVPAHVSAAGLSDFVAGLRDVHNVGGVIFTVPHKPAGLELCDSPGQRAQFAGSVNVMRRTDDNVWVGENTDGQGYIDGAIASGLALEGKRAMLVGVGGAGAAIAYEILNRGAAYLAISEIDSERRDKIIAKLEKEFPGKVGVGTSDPTGFDFIGNATPVGMREGDPLPLDATKLAAHQFVADAITKPEITPLLRIAREKGCSTMPGLGMFNAQADILVDFLLGYEAT